MNPDEILKVISRIEEKYPVDSIIYKERLVWPVIRQHLGFALFFEKPSSSLDPLERKVTTLSVIKSVLGAPAKYVKWKMLKKKAEAEISKAGPIKADTWFLSSPEVYIDKKEGKKYCRHIDPYYEVINKHYPSVFFSTATKADDYYYPVHFFDHSYHVQYSSMTSDFFNLQKVTPEEMQLKEHVIKLNALLKELNVTQTIPLAVILDIKHIHVFERFFHQLLGSKKPKVVFVQCFYSTEKFAMVAACNSLGIKTVEIQHGGAEDFMYVPWRNMNSKNTFLPSHMWCWSRSDKDLILKYNGSTPFLKPFVGGNMWMKKFHNSEINDQDTEISMLKERMKGYQKTILVSLQWSYGISDTLVRMIKESGSKWLWLLRFHPLTPGTEKQKVLDAIKDLPNVEHEICGKVILYNLFRLADTQITYSSTTAMEALSFNIQTILIHPHGRDYYKDLLEKGVLIYADQYNEILNAVEASDKTKFPAEAAEPFIIKVNEPEALQAYKNFVLN